ncbi:MAG: MarR family transcriptional regulator, partial [Pseudomonadota bacterium]
MAQEDAPDREQLKANYLDTLNLIERLHRQLLDVIKDELDRIGLPD